MNEEIINRLKSSDAVSSLTMEGMIHRLLTTLGWKSIRSAYYQDGQTEKFKEIDIIASWSFEGLTRRNVALLTELSLLIECKSISGYHIIVDGEVGKTSMERDMLQHVWWGYDLCNSPSRLDNIIDKSLLSEAIKAQSKKSLHQILYPGDHMLYFKLVPDPISISRFPVFREMNIGSTKELDNSVVWKAFMALNSAGDSFGNRQWHRIEDELLYHCNHEQSKKPIFKDLTNSIFFQALNKYICIHKILVIDAPIWKVDDPISSLPYFRFLQRNIYGHLDQWIDVINLHHFEAYSKTLTNYYKKFYNKTKLWRKM